ncbi:hypothetical protein CALCODRAFT_480744 [Calocera cornea HHB12733]|uniref:DUF7514 domain-containing protein n=1 Tax=Calocera cornea HHB12733 TaxID=1353952 RepID=A0A165IEC9_9BASI|nr:hypothetical protein CALCODRAFT_480744 [Calocera cornea HHB12733]
MGQAVSSSSAYACPQCRAPFAQSAKHCTQCGYANPIFLEAARYGVLSSSRSSEDRALAAHDAGPDGVPCAYCHWPIRRGQMYCQECGHPQPVTEPDPAWTPRTRQQMLRRPSASAAAAARREDPPQTEDMRRAEVPHPMGVEALVTPTGKATRKLEALSNAIFALLTAPGSNAVTQSHSRKPLIDIPRLQYLEQKLGRRPEYMLSALHPSAVLAVYKSMALEHALVPFPPPAQHIEAPCLTRLGLMQYLQHGILYDPHEAVRELRQLLADTPDLPGPPPWLASAQVHAGLIPAGSKGAWFIEENMALSKPHPVAQSKQERMLAELDQLGFNLPGTPSAAPHGHRRQRSSAANIPVPGPNADAALTPGTPFLSPNPYTAWPWGAAGYFPSPYMYPPALPASPYGWAAYPPHPYSPQRSPYRLSPGLPQQELYNYGGGPGAGAGARTSPGRQHVGHSDDAWDYRDYEDIR